MSFLAVGFWASTWFTVAVGVVCLIVGETRIVRGLLRKARILPKE